MIGSRPRISIVTAVFNGADTLPRLLDSYAAQTWPEREIVVMDGGSRDGTVAVLERYGRHITRWVSEPDEGIYDAWNKGVGHSSGDWCLFLGADDYLWDEKVLERAAARLPAGPRTGGPAPPAAGGLRVAYGLVNLVDASGAVLKTLGEPWERAGALIGRRMSLPNPGTFYHRALFSEHGLFDTSYRLSGDYEFLLRELKDRPAKFLDGLLVAGMQVAGATDRPGTAVRRVKEDLRARTRHGLRRGPIWIAPSLWIERKRRILERVIGRRATLALWNFWRRLRGRERLDW